MDLSKDYPKIELIRTPLPQLQIMTAGGVRFSTLIHLWGSNKAGKSTTCYQTGGYFLQDYGENARLKILDSETSADFIRLLSFGIDITHDMRVEVKPAMFIEDGMFSIMQWVKELKPNERLMIIWDTIAASPTKSSYLAATEAADSSSIKMYSGGMSDRTRVIKHFLRQIMSDIYGKKVTVWFPNQVFASMDQYGPKLISGEGNALQHDIHYSLFFARKDSAVVHDASHVADHTESEYALTKSKFSPEFSKCPLYIDNTKGGVIDERESLFMLGKEITIKGEDGKERALVITGGGWFKVIPDSKNRRWDELVKDDESYKYLLSTMVKIVRKKFPTIDRGYLVQGYPALESSEDATDAIIDRLGFNDCFKCSVTDNFSKKYENVVESNPLPADEKINVEDIRQKAKKKKSI